MTTDIEALRALLAGPNYDDCTTCHGGLGPGLCPICRMTQARPVSELLAALPALLDELEQARQRARQSEATCATHCKVGVALQEALAAILTLCRGETPDPLPEHPAVAAVADRLDVLTNALENIEWLDPEASEPDHCPSCNGHRSAGHAEGCPIALALGPAPGGPSLTRQLAAARARVAELEGAIADADRIRMLLAAERAAHEATRAALRAIPCPKCNGKKRVWYDNGWDACPTCYGTGAHPAALEGKS